MKKHSKTAGGAGGWQERVAFILDEVSHPSHFRSRISAKVHLCFTFPTSQFLLLTFCLILRCPIQLNLKWNHWSKAASSYVHKETEDLHTLVELYIYCIRTCARYPQGPVQKAMNSIRLSLLPLKHFGGGLRRDVTVSSACSVLLRQETETFQCLSVS